MSAVASSPGPSTLSRWARRWPVIALAAWNAFVFATRISNVSKDEQASSATKAWAIALASLMLVGVVALIGVLVTGRTRPWKPVEARLVQAVAGLTVVVWAIRGVEILTADYADNPSITSPTAFKVVHLMLGLISIVLAALAWRVAARDQDASIATSTVPVSPVREAVR